MSPKLSAQLAQHGLEVSKREFTCKTLPTSRRQYENGAPVSKRHRAEFTPPKDRRMMSNLILDLNALFDYMDRAPIEQILQRWSKLKDKVEACQMACDQKGIKHEELDQRVDALKIKLKNAIQL